MNAGTDPIDVLIAYDTDSTDSTGAGADFAEELTEAITVAAKELINLKCRSTGQLSAGQHESGSIPSAVQEADMFVLVYSTGLFDAKGAVAQHVLPAIEKRMKKRAGSPGTPVLPVNWSAVPVDSKSHQGLRKLPIAHEGGPIDALDEDDRNAVLAEIADRVVDEAVQLRNREHSAQLRPTVQELVKRLDDIDAELDRNPMTSPEDQLKTPVSRFLESAGPHIRRRSVKVRTEQRMGAGDVVEGVRLDLAVQEDDGALIGHVELKAPGKSANPNRKTGWSAHDKKQWTKLSEHPNLIYCNGREWTLWRTGVLLAEVTLQPGAVDGTVPAIQLADLSALLSSFLLWSPTMPRTPRALAARLAPVARLLRESVAAEVRPHADTKPGAPVRGLPALYQNWRNLLMPSASPDQFADSFAQVFTYALLLARIEDPNLRVPLDYKAVTDALSAHGHKLLASVLQLMGQPTSREPVEGPLGLVEKLISAVDVERLTSKSDPWLYFYEDFLAQYDPAMRKDAGVYYTPIEIVRTQVRLVDEILTSRFGTDLGQDDVTVLDPATGTGTYLLETAARVLDRSSAPGADATSLRRRLNGFELLVGPYAVAHLRMTQMLERDGADMGRDGVNVLLTNTLTDPGNTQGVGQQMAMAWEVTQQITEETDRANVVKSAHTPIRVVIGNPPYDRGSREKALGSGYAAGHRNIVLEETDTAQALLEDFLEPLRAAGAGGQAKNLYNLYVYFWRWAIWKACEQNPNDAGIVSFITASSFLRGPGFVGMREHMRRQFDEIWIIDLGGDNKGARPEPNVFAIQTPVCITIGIQRPYTKTGAKRRHSDRRTSKATVYYQRIRGSREEKLAAVQKVQSPSGPTPELPWTVVDADGWGDRFTPTGSATFDALPLLDEVFPWCHSGVQVKRKWPIAPDAETFVRRWEALFPQDEKTHVPTVDPDLFVEASDRNVSSVCRDIFTGKNLPALDSGGGYTSVFTPVRYGYRSFDVQYSAPDPRICSRVRPPLWQAYSSKQLYLVTLTTTRLGRGPAVTASAYVPDLDYFRGSYGAKNVMPLYRNPQATAYNISTALHQALSATYGTEVKADDIAHYVFGLLGTGAYTARFDDELEESAARVPFTADGGLFAEVAEFGRDLLRYATYGERAAEINEHGAPVMFDLTGSSRNPRSTPSASYPETWAYDEASGELRIGTVPDGATTFTDETSGLFTDVPPAVMGYEVSGLKVVESWLGYRMREPRGRSSSPLDRMSPEKWRFDKELLDLLHVLEYMIAAETPAGDLLDRVLAGTVLTKAELGKPTDAEVKAPSAAELSAMTLDEVERT